MKKIILSLFFITYTYAQRCFINTDIINSQTLFSYQGNVYDITNFNHPGGNIIRQTIGNPLENYVNPQKYAFHLNSNRFRNELANIYAGVLKDNCMIVPPPVIPPPTIAPPVLPPPTVAPPVVPPLTVAPPVVPPPTVAPPVVPPPTVAPPVVPPPTIAPPVVPPPTIAPPVVPPPTIAPPVVVNPLVCVPLNINLNISIVQEPNFIVDYNLDTNIIQKPNKIELYLHQGIGGTRISTKNYVFHGRFDIKMKPSKGSNVITSFYLESDNGNIVNFNIINKNDTMAVIDTNIYNSSLNYDINSKKYNQPVILTDTYNVYSIIWTAQSYEWRFNDIVLRKENKIDLQYFPDFQSKLRISIWEAPPSEWGGPGIQYALVAYPFETVVSNLSINCLNNISNSSKLDESYKEFKSVDMTSISNKLTNKLIIFSALFNIVYFSY